MYATTIAQPYASLIVHGFKKWETRPWKTPHRGVLYIHSSTYQGHHLRKMSEIPMIRDFLQSIGIPDFDSLPRDVILGKADLTAIRQVTEIQPNERNRLCGWFENPAWYAWRMRHPRLLRRPIQRPPSCPTFLGLWTVPDDVLDQIGRIGFGNPTLAGRSPALVRTPLASPSGA